MVKQEFFDALTKIGTCEDEVERRNLLAELQENAGKDYDTLTSLTATNEQLTKDNENLRSANMKLFTRLGKDETDVNDEGGTGENKDNNEKLSFADLFNEKGDLK